MHQHGDWEPHQHPYERVHVHLHDGTVAYPESEISPSDQLSQNLMDFGVKAQKTIYEGAMIVVWLSVAALVGLVLLAVVLNSQG